MQKLALSFALLALGSTPALPGDFSFSFTWGDIPLCTSGHPRRVPSPRFVVSNLPEGTDRIVFRLKDLDAPAYNHGGGKVAIDRDGVIPAGAFTYKSPCPPGGVHRYEWRATAKHGAKVLARARARRNYPE